MRSFALIIFSLFIAPLMAVAEGISLSGTVEMGLVGGSGLSETETTRLQLLTDLEATITMSATTDGGLTFGLTLPLFPGQITPEPEQSEAD